ncbi:uncharacterized protein LOC144884772 [Branchiostoma floridae x Branchiostoma japonicum]
MRGQLVVIGITCCLLFVSADWLTRDVSWVVDYSGTTGPGNALDGDTYSYWNPSGVPQYYNQWNFVLDLTARYTLSRVAIRHIGDTTHDIKDFSLQKSMTGDPTYVWEDVTTVTDVEAGTDARQEYGGFRATARYWRLLISRTWSGYQPWVREVELYGVREKVNCALGYFRCGEGYSCILSWRRCDGTADCSDRSDEENCGCFHIPEIFQLGSRLAMLPNPLNQTTFDDIQNSSAMELLHNSNSVQGERHPQLQEFLSTAIFPRCNVPEEDMSQCSLRPPSNTTTSCVGTQLLPCRSWCEEVFSMSDDLVRDLLPPCDVFPSSQHGCWNPEPDVIGTEVCYHGIGMNYRGTWSKTASGAACLQWSAGQADYYTAEYPWANLDRNYCRNPTGIQRPFCLTGDGSQEECDVIPCNFVGCWDRSPPNYGKRTPSKRFYFLEEKVTYTCNDGYTPEYGSPREATCLEGGTWGYDKPVCLVNQKQKLRKELLEAYSAGLAPENVTINFTGDVEEIVDLDEKKERLIASMIIILSWHDSRLKWNPRHYGGVQTLSVPGDDIWTPSFTLKRNANRLRQGLPKDIPIRISSSGLVQWRVETLTTTVCDADPFYFPADTMDCHICFSAASAIEQTIQCQGESSPSDAHEESHPCGSYSPAIPEGEWYRRDKIFTKDKKEACFALQLSRIPTFHIATTVGPCVILIVLMTITFIMPMDKGDRISFGVTIQLSMVVSLVFVTDVIPVKGALPFFATLIIVCMGLMGLFLFFTIAIIFVHDKKGQMSAMARCFLLRYMARFLLLGDLTEERTSMDEDSHSAIELINYSSNTDGAKVSEGESTSEMWHSTSSKDPATTKRSPKPFTDPQSADSCGLLPLISSVEELTAVVKKGMDELTKAVKNEEEVSDYTLLAKVLDRLCLVVYLVSIAAAIPMTMYLSR